MEIPFEVMSMALEAVRGTPETAPVRRMNMAGTILPSLTMYRGKDFRGTLAANYRHKITRKGSSWQAEGEADPNTLPYWLNMAVRGDVTTPTTPSGATLTRMWAFSRALTADSLESATVWWGDPNIQYFRSDYCMLDEMVITNDATSEDGVAMITLKGQGGFPVQVANPTLPASIAGDFLAGLNMALWIDTSSAMGTTAVTGRLLGVEHTIPTGRTYKHVAGGPLAALDYGTVGIDKSAPTTKLTLEVPDMAQYDLWAAGDTVKCRVIHYGSLIEQTAGPTLWYNYLNVDTVGPSDNRP